MPNKGKLYLLPCPIGTNKPQDVLPAAATALLGRLDYFIVENIRTARRFISSAGYGKRIDLLEFSELNEHTRAEDVAAMLRPVIAGMDAGLISEAGMPAIADPGADLVAQAHRCGVRVVPLSGPSSIMQAVMASGLNGQSFAFNGYLPVKAQERTIAIRKLERRAFDEGQSQFFIETPYRNIKLLEDILRTCRPDTRLCVAASLMQEDEFILTATVQQWKGRGIPDIHKKPAVFGLL